ncbi:uncharacterized protein [Cicer arietinum]|uniref:Protein LATERAL ORGAN BOUNDARIES-like n=1 Tax=Cicer arietinum TaxID=3827 RepID=A0A1S2Y7E3_CICAR|nr:protein LATERAL ORGAN BOUNDARIES-like [Cicer arietinum]
MSSSNSPCAACKFLRQKCTQECYFAPYFSPDNPQRFASVHRVFGASKVAKLLKELHAEDREDAVKSLAYEAESRIRDPVYGCVGFISVLQQRLKEIRNELQIAKKELLNYNFNPQTMNYLLANPGTVIMPQQQQQQQWNPQFAGLNNGSNNFGNDTVGGVGELVVSDAQQHQEQEFLEAQRFVAATQQEYFLRLGGGGVGVGVGVASSLGMGNFENGGGDYYRIEQQGEEQQQNYVALGNGHPIEAQLMFSPQNQETSEDGRSVGSAHPSCN